MQGGRQVSIFWIHNCHENGESAPREIKDLQSARYFHVAWCAAGT
jgi:hypothetical protein